MNSDHGGEDGVVNTTIEKRDLKFYILTHYEVQALGQNTILGTILLTLASIFVGAGFSAQNPIPFWVVGGASFLVSLYFLYVANRKIINELTRPKEFSTSPAVTLSESGVSKAMYGSSGTWIDITERVKAARNEGGPILVSNGLAGRDPVPGVVKILRVTYKVNGEGFEKDFTEGTVLELPAGVY